MVAICEGHCYCRANDTHRQSEFLQPGFLPALRTNEDNFWALFTEMDSLLGCESKPSLKSVSLKALGHFIL